MKGVYAKASQRNFAFGLDRLGVKVVVANTHIQRSDGFEAHPRSKAHDIEEKNVFISLALHNVMPGSDRETHVAPCKVLTRLSSGSL